MSDRITKTLPALIVGALVGFLIRPSGSTPPARADVPSSALQQVASVAPSGSPPFVFTVQGGIIYAYQVVYTKTAGYKLKLIDKKPVGAQ